MSERSLTILVVVAVILGHGLPRPVQAGVTGKLDVLKTVAAEHRKNKDALRTWRGTAVVEELINDDPADSQSQVQNVDFVLDRAAGAMRWKSLVRAVAAEQPVQLEVHGLRAGGTFHDL